MFSVRLKQTRFPHTVPMISKLTSKKVLNRLSVGCTHCPKLRFKCYAYTVHGQGQPSPTLSGQVVGPDIWSAGPAHTGSGPGDLRGASPLTPGQPWPGPVI